MPVPEETERDPASGADVEASGGQEGPTEGDPNRGAASPMESTAPYGAATAAAAAAVAHVHLDPPRRSGSLGRVGHYEVFEIVGQGGMGVVVRAFDTQLSRTVAIKLMSPLLMANQQ